ncbi:hypothetical protein TRFO_42777 [Tritrichomonas foetus]|uniref:Uncharacterized protein n=1 Tax=Tritrichomonas foetus TaxID=1144522 RepID=A0A1J4KV28_9EUKA|nr:hypothetical protein TRFO_42777 [Tritrichomonas foetus]|eukprot:OHT14994.1 hypothetical protein TRFO_42777 [Tritrichomonas foetus]
MKDAIFLQVNPTDVYLTGITTVDPKSPNAEVEQKEIIFSRLNDDDTFQGIYIVRISTTNSHKNYQIIIIY